MLKPDLGVLRNGVEDGRRTFGNTLKYVSIAIASNFGNMVSMALATPLLPFLPLLPKQILLNNFLSDIPALGISTDRVDPELLLKPQRWNVRDVERFMVIFGLGSSLFDFITFGVLLFAFRAGEPLFHTGWFFVSLMTQMLVVLVLRTRRLAWRSSPSVPLVITMLIALVIGLSLPFTGALARLLGFQTIGLAETAAFMGIALGYFAFTEALKHFYYRHLAARSRT